VAERDEDGLVDAILRLTDDAPFVQLCKDNLRAERERFRWHRVLERVTSYCAVDSQPANKWVHLPPLASMAVSDQTSRWKQTGIRRAIALYHQLPPAARPTRLARTLLAHAPMRSHPS